MPAMPVSFREQEDLLHSPASVSPPAQCVNLQTVNSKTTAKAATRSRLLPGLKVSEGFLRHPFDLEFGVRTSGLIAGRNLRTGHRNDRHNTAYYGVAPSVFQAMIVRWRRSRPIAPIDAFTFIDLGAGMGRAVLLASQLPFRAVLGVELNPTLARIARRNLATWRAAGRALAPTKILCRDALDFQLPPGPCVVFLFNPFGAPVLRRLAESWARTFAARPGQLDILYINDEQRGQLDSQPGFACLFRGPVRRSRADAITDRRILTHQPDGEYAFAAFEDCSLHRWLGAAAS